MGKMRRRKSDIERRTSNMVMRKSDGYEKEWCARDNKKVKKSWAGGKVGFHFDREEKGQEGINI